MFYLGLSIAYRGKVGTLRLCHVVHVPAHHMDEEVLPGEVDHAGGG